MLKQPSLCGFFLIASMLFAATGCDVTTRTEPSPDPTKKKVDVDVNVKGGRVDVDVKSKP